MRRRTVKIVLALMLGWYLAGPVVETVDCWDTLQTEMLDIARSAGGLLTLVVAGGCLAMALARKLRERCSDLARTFSGYSQSWGPQPVPTLLFLAPVPTYSPPLPLRM